MSSQGVVARWGWGNGLDVFRSGDVGAGAVGGGVATRQWESKRMVSVGGSQVDKASATQPAKASAEGGWPRLHLASQSPRRRMLLDEAGIEHEASHPGLDDGELKPGNVAAPTWSMALAYLKAASAAKARATGVTADRRAPAVVLGADTVVVKTLSDGTTKIIGQPSSLEEALQTLMLLRNGEHEVITGVAMLEPKTGRRELFHDVARVTVGEITDEQIAEYLATGQWRGKAGGYNLSERIEAGWPVSCSGDPATVMGLPIKALLPRLRAFVRGN